ncbi:hypothetical protein L2E82_11811 [Cichorium intybus]|nr:hypothetical protein L2E82_45161 [Cichorium intybus]KAI3781787.1 hypothetical protein L2E82_11811 [Cichorium intybus]
MLLFRLKEVPLSNWLEVNICTISRNSAILGPRVFASGAGKTFRYICLTRFLDLDLHFHSIRHYEIVYLCIDL